MLKKVLKNVLIKKVKHYIGLINVKVQIIHSNKKGQKCHGPVELLWTRLIINGTERRVSKNISKQILELQTSRTNNLGYLSIIRGQVPLHD